MAESTPKSPDTFPAWMHNAIAVAMAGPEDYWHEVFACSTWRDAQIRLRRFRFFRHSVTSGKWHSPLEPLFRGRRIRAKCEFMRGKYATGYVILVQWRAELPEVSSVGTELALRAALGEVFRKELTKTD